MKRNVLSARVLTIMLAAGIAFSFLQTPVGPVSAMAAEEVSAEEGPAAGEQSEAPEVSVPEETPRQEDAAPADADEPAESAPKEEPQKAAEEKAAEEEASGGTQAPAITPGRTGGAFEKKGADGTEDEILEETAEASMDSYCAGSTYNDVFASLKGSGYSLSQARSSASSSYTTGQFMYVWAWLHDASGNLYKSYGSGTVNMTLSIYRPDGSCAYSYTYNNSDNNWIGTRLDKAGTWKIQSRISGALTGNNIQTVTVQEAERSSFNDVFASLKGSGYSLSQARESASSVYTTGQFMYVWAWLHDANGNLYKSYGSGTVNMTLSIYRPDGSCAYSYTYNNSDNNWIGTRLDKAGTWKIQSSISGAITSSCIRNITVKDAPAPSVILPSGVKIGNAAGTMYVGDSRTLSAAVSPSNASDKGVTWKSSNTSVMTVNSSGKITAKKAGTARITVTTKANGKTASITVTVKVRGGEAVYGKAKSFLGKKYPYFKGQGFHFRAWCADFVSYCAKLAGQTKAIPKNSSVAGIRNAIKKAGGKEYSKAAIKKGSYVPKRGDIIIFKSNGASHVGIVDYASKGTIYYIDGNNTSNGNGNKACVHYSKCAYGNSRFTCVLHPRY